MPVEIYEIVALAARFWFLFLMVLIVWRSYRWYARERRQRKKRLRLLPDAGYIGEFVVMQGAGDLERGQVLSVPFEGTLGYVRSNDLCIPVPGVASRHLWFSYDDRRGLVMTPVGKNDFSVDQIPMAEAAEIGTRKVMTDHATIGVVVTTDGTVAELRALCGIDAEAVYDELKR